MAKRVSKLVKQKKHADDTTKSMQKPQEPMSTKEQENQFNFGGLPERNLKKNLGCG